MPDREDRSALAPRTSERLVEDARRRRAELLMLHRRRDDQDDPGDLDGRRLDDVIALTEALLEAEQQVEDARDAEDAAHDRRFAGIVGAGLAVPAVVALVVCVVVGGWGWPFALTVSAVVAAVVLLVLNAVGPAYGHRARRTWSVVVLVAGVVAAAVALPWSPIWLRVLALVVVGLSLLVYVATFVEPQPVGPQPVEPQPEA